jgi:hypothetical protein
MYDNSHTDNNESIVLTLISDSDCEQFPQHISHDLGRGGTEGYKGVGEDGGREEVGYKESGTRTDSLHADGPVLRGQVVLGTVLHQLKGRVGCREVGGGGRENFNQNLILKGGLHMYVLCICMYTRTTRLIL